MAGLLKTVVSDAGAAAHLIGDLSLDPTCIMLVAASADCAMRAVAFRAQYELLTKFENMLTMPLLVLTTLTGFLSALQSGLGSAANMGKSISTVVAITGFLSALVHTINQRLQFAARAEKSLGLSKSYQNVASKIDAELNMMKTEVASAPSARPGLPLPAALGGEAGLLGKIPGFAGLAGESSAAPAASSSAAAPGPTTATKAKFLQMIQTEIAQLNGSVDDMPAALAAVGEAAVGLVAVSSLCGCLKRHKPVLSAAEGEGTALAELPSSAAAAGKAALQALDGAPLSATSGGSMAPSRASSRARPAGDAPGRQARRAPGSRGEERPEAKERKGGMDDAV